MRRRLATGLPWQVINTNDRMSTVLRANRARLPIFLQFDGARPRPRVAGHLLRQTGDD